ncbi:hypothetical protein J1C67_02415 [Clostridium gasigenes]|uniref:hypothetical protein n=1 Tax=Clostridium gasigenes TaxID=94869 RepID=UPI001438564F|nr:hypothetical protein [Clostridium gasigenes]NKF06189.1 hypothetical protein [Clostridium gasigenes]QSW20076.1 hypothetical protein J1C67_02415 [Clostridium gasigenes]
MKLQERNKVSKATKILNTMAIIMVIFAIFNIYTSHMYISSLIKQGFDPIKQITEVINYYLNSVTQYVFYGICLAALSYIIKKVVYLGDVDSINKLDKDYLEKESVVEEEYDEIDMILKELDVE